MRSVDLPSIDIRIKSISINNIKNVENGEIQLDVPARDSFGASIIGLYGQNGSGKTAMVWALELLKKALSGLALPKDSFYYICQGQETGTVSATFSLKYNDVVYTVYYTISIKAKVDNSFFISYESMEYSSETLSKRKILCVDYNKTVENGKDCAYGPSTRISEMAKINKQVRQELFVSQELSLEKKMSYLFNERTRSLFEKIYDNELSEIMEELCLFGKMNLVVLNRNADSTYRMDLQPLTLRFSSNTRVTLVNDLLIGLNVNTATNEQAFSAIQVIVNYLDIILKEIIPGFELDVKEISRELNQEGQTQIRYELVSKRDNRLTPLRYESEGIRKIIYIISSLVAMYNNSSVFIAIDELDSGIFEYLLGELIAVINDTGKGQLLFTSHNLRPLEVLDSSNIYVTTTNPRNKYIRFAGIKDSNNLRTTLLRTIDLGGQKESIYEPTSSYQISKAFRKAGDIDDGNQ